MTEKISNKPSLTLYNTLTRTVEPFQPQDKKTARFYACGPTVYDFAHLGNFRSFLAEDLLRRTLEYAGYKVKHVMNITDVGHLTGDSDTGEDKLEVGARREKKSAWEIANFYTRAFLKDLDRLNIERPDKMPRATDHIKPMIELIAALEKKGFTYQLPDGIYFDTSKLSSYGKLSKKAGIKPGARVEMVPGKKHPTDFALWKFSPSTSSGLPRRQMEWDSPWGKGFPGWHIECSAMSVLYLGQPLDIHAGGVDHIPTHHENEIAQTEGATGKPLSRFFFHVEFMLVDGRRMGKSEGNAFTVEDLIKKRSDPLAFRYLMFQTHYRQLVNFTWEALAAAQNGLNGIRELLMRDEDVLGRSEHDRAKREIATAFFHDLDSPKALALLHEAGDHRLWIDFEPILGLKLETPTIRLTKVQRKLVHDRERARRTGDWKRADEIRKRLAKEGVIVEDTPSGSRVLTTND